MSDKLPMCCARQQAKLTIAERDLATYVRRATFADQHNRPYRDAPAQIAKLKATIKMLKDNVVDHEAEHADGAA